MHTYDKVCEGLIDLRAMATSALLQLADTDPDPRLRDIIGGIIIYERTVQQGRRRVIKEM